MFDVVYQKLPLFCSDCHAIGHSLNKSRTHCSSQMIKKHFNVVNYMNYRVRIPKIVHELSNKINNIVWPTETYKDDQEYFKQA
jgi:hypothetical protein